MNRFKLIFIIVLIGVSVMSQQHLFAQNFGFDDPQIKNGERLVYRVSVIDKKPVFVTYAIYCAEDAYRLVVEGEGQFIRAMVHKNGFVPVSVSSSKYQLDVVSVYSKDAVHMLIPGKKIDTSLKIKLNVQDLHTLDYALRGFPVKKDHRIDFEVVNSNPGPTVVQVYALLVDEEAITVPAGTFACYKIEIGVRGALGMFVPKDYYWIAKKKPFYLVKRARRDGPAYPKETLELAKIE